MSLTQKQRAVVAQALRDDLEFRPLERERIVTGVRARYDRDEAEFVALLAEIDPAPAPDADIAELLSQIPQAISLTDMGRVDLALRARFDRDSSEVRKARQDIEARATPTLMRAMGRMAAEPNGDRLLEQYSVELGALNGHPLSESDVADFARHEAFLTAYDGLVAEDRQLIESGTNRLLLQQWISSVRTVSTTDELLQTEKLIRTDDRLTEEEQGLLMTLLNDQAAVAIVAAAHERSNVANVKAALNATLFTLEAFLMPKQGEDHDPPSDEDIQQLMMKFLQGFAANDGYVMLRDTDAKLVKGLEAAEVAAVKHFREAREEWLAAQPGMLQNPQLDEASRAHIQEEATKIQKDLDDMTTPLPGRALPDVLGKKRVALKDILEGVGRERRNILARRAFAHAALAASVAEAEAASANAEVGQATAADSIPTPGSTAGIATSTPPAPKRKTRKAP